MTNPMINPNYSGVTIQIANPAVYADGGRCSGANPYQSRQEGINQYPIPTRNDVSNFQQNPIPDQYGQCYLDSPQGIAPRYNAAYNTGYVTNPNREQGQIPQQIGAYPPQYYLNDYNYQNTNPNTQENAEKILAELQK